MEETIDKLREAGIRVWMLTGDKFQTALEISRACNLVKPTDEVFAILGTTATEVKDCMDRIVSSNVFSDTRARARFSVIVRLRSACSPLTEPVAG